MPDAVRKRDLHLGAARQLADRLAVEHDVHRLPAGRVDDVTGRRSGATTSGRAVRVCGAMKLTTYPSTPQARIGPWLARL